MEIELFRLLYILSASNELKTELRDYQLSTIKFATNELNKPSLMSEMDGKSFLVEFFDS